MREKQWMICPVCNSKTRIKVRADTKMELFPLYCPKCKQTTLVNISNFKISIIKEPDAKTQSQ